MLGLKNLSSFNEEFSGLSPDSSAYESMKETKSEYTPACTGASPHLTEVSKESIAVMELKYKKLYSRSERMAKELQKCIMQANIMINKMKNVKNGTKK